MGEKMKKNFFILLFFSCSAFACQKWPYLQSAAFKKARQQRVAKIVAACDTIIEIGGAGAPLSGFLPSDKKVIVIDPEIKRKEEGNIKHIPIGFEKWDEQPTSANYAVVILGLELVMPDGAWPKLYELIDRSAMTIIEYSAQNKEARKQFKDIKNSVIKDWRDAEEFEINGYELSQFKGQVFNHRVLQRTKSAEEKDQEEQE